MNLRDLKNSPLLDDSFPLPLDHPFTTRQARSEGLTSRHLAALVDARLLTRPVSGVYLACQAGDSPRLRAECVRLVVPDGAIVCDRHAGWLHDAEMILAPNEHLHLCPLTVFRPSGRGRLRNGLVDSGERNLSPDDIMEIDGIAVTTPIRTAWDLGRQRYPEPAIAGIDSMLRLELFSKEELLAGIERFKGQRWVTTLRWIAPLADGRAGSPGESVLRLRWITAGLPEPQLQVEVWRHGVLIAVLDIANEELGYSAEYDGEEWHTSPEQRAHDARRREAAAGCAWTIDAFVKSNVFGVHADADAILKAGAQRARAALARRIHI